MAIVERRELVKQLKRSLRQGTTNTSYHLVDLYMRDSTWMDYRVAKFSTTNVR
jgi:hypothetical protein